MSFLKKKLKRLSFLASAYELELEEVKSLDDEYCHIFSKDFSEESTYASEVSQKENTDTPEGLKKPKKKEKITEGPLKILHRFLARKTHPDKGGCEEEFKKIQMEFENQNISSLLVRAHKYDDIPEMSAKSLEEIERLIEKQQQEIKEIKSTVRWAWALSDKSESLRSQIQKSLGINPDDFKKWKSSSRSN